MSRHAWIVVSLAALFGLRAPLCVYTCTQIASQAERVAADPATSEPPPCHAAGTNPAPRPPSGGHECDCDRTQLVVTKSGIEGSLGSPELPGLAVAAPETCMRADRTAPRRIATRIESLPPSDILLLKSTLLI